MCFSTSDLSNCCFKGWLGLNDYTNFMELRINLWQVFASSADILYKFWGTIFNIMVCNLMLQFIIIIKCITCYTFTIKLLQHLLRSIYLRNRTIIMVHYGSIYNFEFKMDNLLTILMLLNFVRMFLIFWIFNTLSLRLFIKLAFCLEMKSIFNSIIAFFNILRYLLVSLIPNISLIRRIKICTVQISTPFYIIFHAIFTRHIIFSISSDFCSVKRIKY